MTNLYFDNSATSWPKPESVITKMTDILRHLGGNAGRSAHRMSIEANSLVYTAREEIGAFFGLANPSRVIFTFNCTDGLNLAIKGTLQKGDHCLTTSLEHNSVIRPLNRLKQDGIIHFDIVPADKSGLVDLQALADHIRSNTRLVVSTHASNVTGALQPIEDIAALCRRNGLILLVDAAQSAGNVPIAMEQTGIHMLAASGHKYLLGPQGTGILLINGDIRLTPLKEGGTGTDSGNTTQPNTYPEKYESGTLNLPGIGGLLEGIRHLQKTGFESLRRQKIELRDYLIARLSAVNGLQLVGVTSSELNTGVISFQVKGSNTTALATALGNNHNIKFRYGLHCAPLAHQTMGTFPEGTIRLSPGYQNSRDDVDFLVTAIQEEMKRL